MEQNKTKIILDSSADHPRGTFMPYSSVPLTVRTEQKEYTDDEHLDVHAMIEELSHYKGRSSTSCPNPSDWLDAFGDGEEIYCIALTALLSGSYNAACIAKQEYEQLHPGRRVHVFNSRSAGPELRLLADKIADLKSAGAGFEQTVAEVEAYNRSTALVFMLQSLTNLANNGRVSPIVAKMAGVLNIRLVGEASEDGVLTPLEKCRGEQKTLQVLVDHMTKTGFRGGRVLIAHCLNKTAAEALGRLISERYHTAKIEIYPTRGLCSFYAEKGGLLVGYENAE